MVRSKRKRKIAVEDLLREKRDEILGSLENMARATSAYSARSSMEKLNFRPLLGQFLTPNKF